MAKFDEKEMKIPGNDMAMEKRHVDWRRHEAGD
jgi:hypothetical protein